MHVGFRNLGKLVLRFIDVLGGCEGKFSKRFRSLPAAPAVSILLLTEAEKTCVRKNCPGREPRIALIMDPSAWDVVSRSRLATAVTISHFERSREISYC